MREQIKTRPTDQPVVDLRAQLSAGKRKLSGAGTKANDELEGSEIDIHDGCKPDKHVSDYDNYEDGTATGGGGGASSGR